MRKIVIFFVFISTLFAVGLQKKKYCFQKRVYPYKYTIVFNGMKESLLTFGMTIKNIDKKNDFISAEGTVNNGDDIYNLTFTILFQPLEGNVTKVTTLVNYDKLSKESDSSTKVSVGVVTTPIPLPWDKSFQYQGSGSIQDPQFFDVFYLNLDKELFEYQMKTYK